jgi:hypothetical protein
MTTPSETYAQITSLLVSFKAEADPLADRFLKFLVETNTYRYVDSKISADDPFPYAGYHLELSAGTEPVSVDGLTYSSTVYDTGYEEYVFFVMPFDYMEDPDQWERDLIMLSDSHRPMAIEALKKAMPGLIDDTEDKVGIGTTEYLDYMPNHNISLLVFDISHLATYKGAYPHIPYGKEKYKVHKAFFYNIKENAVYLSRDIALNDLTNISERPPQL